MKIGDEVEVLYAGEWLPGKIVSQQNVEADPKQQAVRVFSVDTGKSVVMGVSAENGNLRVRKE
jgi:hypothetical protein